MSVDYNKIAWSFSKSRKNMKWEEIDYFISSYLSDFENKNFLDIWCGSWRLLEQFSSGFDIDDINYTWIDLSSEMLIKAKENFKNKNFLELDMLELSKLENRKFDYIFFIASFHHLDSLEFRLTVLNKAKDLLNKGWIIFMTNWSLSSDINNEKYKKSIIKNSINDFWGMDYNILFWDYFRYYHGFHLSELEYLFKQTWFEVLENREFPNKKNFVSIIKKL
jgi:SAM-dependent methyltransferase